MPLHRRAAACALLACALVACELASDLVAEGLDLASVRNIRELPPERALRWLEADGVMVVGGRGIGEAEAIAAARRGEVGVALVIGDEPAGALRIAAELARAGVPRVGVVRGGSRAWAEARPPTLALAPDGK